MRNEMSRDEKDRERFFVNKTVKLVKSDGFVLTGKILKMDKNDILFETSQATSLIKIHNIKELVLVKEGKK
jgi:sRNA-binding regulator protein Hfq